LRAAAEACQLFRTIVQQGWEVALSRHNGREMRAPLPGHNNDSSSNRPEIENWAERLIHRKYTEKFHPNLEREFSARIQHSGTGYYFPLGTDDRKVAAARAMRIHQNVVRKGWEKTIQRFPRELSLAFHWLDSPVVWTYTTIQTQIRLSRPPALTAPASMSGTLNVAIVESDPTIRKALEWCIDQQEGYCTVGFFARAADALRLIPQRPFHLVLANRTLADQTGTAFLNSLAEVQPNIVGLMFSVYDDCDLLFARAPGGAASYLFRRTLPTRILEPISEAWQKGNLTRDYIADNVRTYFEKALSFLPASGSSHSLANLTQRELEILGLLSKGQSDKEIADLLRISTWTVHGHLKKIFEKLDVHNRTEAVLKYLHK
jgi:DNA-binding NarL/FixJ family response regulator